MGIFRVSFDIWLTRIKTLLLSLLIIVIGWKGYYLLDNANKFLITNTQTSQYVQLYVKSIPPPEYYDKLITQKFDETKKDLIKQTDRSIKDGLGVVDKQLTALNTNVNTQVSKITDATAGEIEGTQDAVLDLVKTEVQPMFKPVQKTLDIVSDNMETIGQCYYPDPDNPEGIIPNPYCFANRFISTTSSIENFAQSGEKMAKAIAQVTPSIAQNVDKTTGNFEKTTNNITKITDKFTEKKPWYTKVIGTAVAVGSVAAKILF